MSYPIQPLNFTHVTRQVLPTVWQITSVFPTPVNCWLVKSTDGLTLIDAAHPWSAEPIVSLIESLGQPLRRIIITHAHPDHAGAAREVAAKTGATVMAHACDLPYLQNCRSMADEKGFWQCLMVLKTGQKLGLLAAPPVENVVPVSDGEIIGNLRVIHTPGHTPGSISLWSDDERAIFPGDNLLYTVCLLHVGLPWFTLDLDTQKTSLRRYVDLPARMLMAGHGPVFVGDVAAAIKKLI